MKSMPVKKLQVMKEMKKSKAEKVKKACQDYKVVLASGVSQDYKVVFDRKPVSQRKRNII